MRGKAGAPAQALAQLPGSCPACAAHRVRHIGAREKIRPVLVPGWCPTAAVRRHWCWQVLGAGCVLPGSRPRCRLGRVHSSLRRFAIVVCACPEGGGTAGGRHAPLICQGLGVGRDHCCQQQQSRTRPHGLTQVPAAGHHSGHGRLLAAGVLSHAQASSPLTVPAQCVGEHVILGEDGPVPEAVGGHHVLARVIRNVQGQGVNVAVERVGVI